MTLASQKCEAFFMEGLCIEEKKSTFRSLS